MGNGIHCPHEADRPGSLPRECRSIIQARNAIVSLTDTRWVWWDTTTQEAGVPEHRHKWIQCADSSTQVLLTYMSDICEFIDGMSSPNLSSLSSLPIEHEQPNGGPSEAILVHCDLGISRSPAISIAYLMRKLRIQQADVISFVKSKQKVKPSSNFISQLQIWEQVGYQI